MTEKKKSDKKRISVEVEGDFHKQVKVKAAQDGVKIADLVRALLGSWIKGDVKVVQQ